MILWHENHGLDKATCLANSFREEKINILAISTSEIKLSVIINEHDTLKAVKKLHTTFDLD